MRASPGALSHVGAIPVSGDPGPAVATFQVTEPVPSSRRLRRGGSVPVCPKAVKQYLHLVHQVVASLARRLPANVLRDDLLAAGVFGLVDSLRKNGGDEGETFEWYARLRIRGAIFDELRAQDWLPRRARSKTRAEDGRSECASPSAAEPLRSVVPKALVSLHDINGIEEAIHLATASDDPAEAIEARSEVRALAKAIEQLPDRERQIVGMHYFHGVKFKDIGAELGVSEPRVSQLHARALGRLRGMLGRAA
jgi:RNA polymerase sigma factor FliA